MGDARDVHASVRGVAVGIPPLHDRSSNPRMERYGGECQVGSLTGAVASQRVTEALEGSLRMVGNHLKSVKAEGSLTVRRTGRTGTKVGLSDLAVPRGRAVT